MLVAAPMALTLLLTGCTPADQAVDGIVVDIDSEGLGRMRAFTLRTRDGESVTFDVAGPMDLSGEAFPPDHLHQHMALGEGVAVAYDVIDGRFVATRLVDAPWQDVDAGGDR